MPRFRQRVQNAFILACKVLPFVTLAWMVLVHVRDGVDLPYLDDWRDYASSTIGTYSPAYLFRPANDTLYPVGRLLDSLFLDALDGNTLIYQTMSMTLVLGGILALTLNLLRVTLRDPLLVACAFIPTLLALQVDSYWGRQYVAYHQAIPLICLLAILTIIVAAQWRPVTRMVAVFFLGLVAGGAYISGAFACLGAALVLVAVGILRPHRRDVLQAGLALLLASLITSVAQAYVIVVVQHGKTHHPDATWATPLEPDFWLFTLGKIGRSLALPLDYPIVSLVVTGIVAIGTAILAITVTWRLAKAQQIDRTSENRGIVTVSLATAVAVYLVLVAAGRTNLSPPEMNAPLEVFEIGFARFHFFWVTAIWPWVFAAALIGLRRFLPSVFPWLAGAITGLVAVAIMTSGALNYRFAFAEAAGVKQRGIACLQDKLISADTLMCPELYPAALNSLYAQAVEAGAPFAHAAPPTLRRYNETQRVQLLGPDQLAPARTKIQNAEQVTWNGASLTLAAAVDPKLEFRVYRRRQMSVCRMLDVSVNLRGKSDQTAQLFFLPPDGEDFDEGHSQRIVSDGENDIHFTVSSRDGFADLLRLEPFEGSGEVIISHLRVHCLLP